MTDDITTAIAWKTFSNQARWPREDVHLVGRPGYFTVTIALAEFEHPEKGQPTIRLDGAFLQSNSRRALEVGMRADGMTDFENDSTWLCKAELHVTHDSWDAWFGHTINGVMTSLLLWTPQEAQEYAKTTHEGAYMPKAPDNGFEPRWGNVAPQALRVQVRVLPRRDAPWPTDPVEEEST